MKNFKDRAAKPKWKAFKPFEEPSFCPFGHLCCIFLPLTAVTLCFLQVSVNGLASKTPQKTYTFKIVSIG